MSTKATYWILATSFILAAAGFLLPFWPLSLVGIFISAVSGRWVFAIAIGLLLDVAYGAPEGSWHMLFFPFALFGVFATGLRFVALRYLLPQQTDHL